MNSLGKAGPIRGVLIGDWHGASSSSLSSSTCPSGLWVLAHPQRTSSPITSLSLPSSCFILEQGVSTEGLGGSRLVLLTLMPTDGFTRWMVMLRRARRILLSRQSRDCGLDVSIILSPTVGISKHPLARSTCNHNISSGRLICPIAATCIHLQHCYVPLLKS